jgi:soluble lytic murein transglycosylase-like protein
MNLHDGSASIFGNLGLAAAAYNAGPSRVSGLALGDRARQLCSRLESISGSCLVYRN